MGYFLFIDESGQDHKESPYEVLAGVAIKDEDLWKLVQEIHDAEIAHFGRRYSDGKREVKARSVIKRKAFTHAAYDPIILPHEVPNLAKECLDNGQINNSRRHQKALALAKIAYVSDVFAICERYRCKIFASIVEPDAPPTQSGGLRKDYGYLFERFFRFLEDETTESGYPQQGVLVFDELEKTKSHILIEQAHKYFKDTATGRLRASLVIPEPFFIHSDLTTGVQIADLAAYCIAWGLRFGAMDKPVRAELKPYVEKIFKLRHRAIRNMMGNPNFVIWSIAYIRDLRTTPEKLAEELVQE